MPNGKARIPKKPNETLSIFLAFLFIFFAIPLELTAEEFASPSEPKQQTNTSAVVYLIDKSSSMFWIFDELREDLKPRSIAGNRLPEECLITMLECLVSLHRGIDSENLKLS